MALVSGTFELATWLFSAFDNPATKLALGIHADGVFYGDQNRIPVHPAVCIESGEKAREGNYIGSGGFRKVTVEQDFFIIVYHSLIDNSEVNRQNLDEMLDAVETFLHSNMHMKDLPNGDDRVISSLCTRTEPGFMDKAGGQIFRAGRITFHTLSQQMLPC